VPDKNRNCDSCTVQYCALFPRFGYCLLYWVESCFVHTRWTYTGLRVLLAVAVGVVERFVTIVVAAPAAVGY